MPVSKAQFNTGDFVEYRPIGGAHDNVSHSKGEIENVFESGDGHIRYAIRNENTGKTTNYQESNIVGKTERGH